jgi:hypothetical protein
VIVLPAIKPALATPSTVLSAGLSFAASAAMPEGCKGDVSPLPSSPFEQNAQMDVAGPPPTPTNTHGSPATNGATDQPTGGTHDR